MSTFKADAITFAGGLVTDLTEPQRSLVGETGGAARRLENVTVWPQGAVLTDPAWRFMGQVRRLFGQSARARFAPVVFSEAIGFLAEIGHYEHMAHDKTYLRVWTPNGVILDGDAPYELDAPYTADELDDLQWFSDAGTLYVWHPSHPPYQLVYETATSWRFEPVPCTWGPFRDENRENITLTASGVSGSVTLTASGEVFEAEMVGALWRLGHRVPAEVLAHEFTADGSSDPVSVPKDVTFQVTAQGNWTGTLVVERSEDLEHWESVLVLSSLDGTDYDQPRTETYDDAWYRLTMTGWVPAGEEEDPRQCDTVLQVESHLRYGYGRVTAVLSATQLTLAVIEELASTDPTRRWSEGAWSPYRGYPRSGGVIENRLVHQANRAQPTTQWMSASNDYDNMRTGPVASDALTFTLTTRRGDPFLWLLAEHNIYTVGTPSAILQLSAADPNQALSGTNQPSIRRRIDGGAAALTPVRIGGMTVFVDANRQRVLYAMYDWQQDRLVAVDMGFAAPGLFSAGIRRIAFQPAPFALLHVLLDDGVLCSCTIEERPEATIAAWHRHGDGIDDVVWLDGLWRTVVRGTRTTVERQDPHSLERARDDHRLDGYIDWQGETYELMTLFVYPNHCELNAVGHPFSDGARLRIGGCSDERGEWLTRHVVVAEELNPGTSFRLRTLQGSYVQLPDLVGQILTVSDIEEVSNTFGGLDHFASREVYALADGAQVGPLTVSGGAITTSQQYHRVAVGLMPAAAEIKPLRLWVPTRDGSTRGRRLHVSAVWLALFQSYRGQVGKDLDHLTDLLYGDETVALHTTDLRQPVDGQFDPDATMVFVQDTIHPFGIRALMLEVGIHG